MPTDETNQLLREIRDILASQDKKYDDHLKKVQETYMQQVEINDEQRKKSVRVIFALFLLIVVVALVVFSIK